MKWSLAPFLLPVQGRTAVDRAAQAGRRLRDRNAGGAALRIARGGKSDRMRLGAAGGPP